MKAMLSLAWVLGVCVLAGAQADTVDPVGTWKCEYEIGGQERTSTLTIKRDGDKLAGTMSWPDQKETRLKDVKLKDGVLTFSAERRFMENKFTVEYTLKIEGDKFKGKGAAEMRGREAGIRHRGKAAEEGGRRGRWPGACQGDPALSGAAPGSEKWDWAEKTTKDRLGRPVVSDVVRPVLLHFPAEKGKAVGTAMIVAPGGGFRALMMSYEGEDVARRLNAMGIDAFVLKYRLTHTGPGAPGAGGEEARGRRRPPGGEAGA